jgi:hypothetical protein
MYANPFTDYELQGDVYADIPIVSIKILSDASPSPGDISVNATFRRTHAAIISHSCDSAKRKHILVAPLVVLRVDELEDLERRGGIDVINDPRRAEFLHQFHYKPFEAIGPDPRVVNFTNISYVDRKVLRNDRKVAELTPDARGLLKGKLFAHFARKEANVPTVEIGLPGEILDPPPELQVRPQVTPPSPPTA